MLIKSMTTKTLALTSLLMMPIASQAFVIFTDPLRGEGITDNTGAIAIEVDEERIRIFLRLNGDQTAAPVVGRSVELTVNSEIITAEVSSGSTTGYSGCHSLSSTVNRSFVSEPGLLPELAANATGSEPLGACRGFFTDTIYSWELESSEKIAEAAESELLYSVFLHEESGTAGETNSVIDIRLTDSLNWDVVPEPSALILVGLTGMMMGCRRRRVS